MLPFAGNLSSSPLSTKYIPQDSSTFAETQVVQGSIGGNALKADFKIFKVAMAMIYLIGAFWWSMPESFPLRPVVTAWVDRPFRFLGLWQGWNMFAPNPISEDIFLSVIGTFDNGERVEWEVTRMNTMDYFTRYRMERWRKFCNDNMRLDSNKHLWHESAVWFAADLSADFGKRVTKLEMIRHWQPAAIPDAQGTIPERSEWKQHNFHTELVGH